MKAGSSERRAVCLGVLVGLLGAGGAAPALANPEVAGSNRTALTQVGVDALQPSSTSELQPHSSDPSPDDFPRALRLEPKELPAARPWWILLIIPVVLLVQYLIWRRRPS